jgi:hypothetical protein
MTTIHDIVMGAARPGRSCGDCVACCQVLNIDQPDMLKPAGQMCLHCTGKGCGVYAVRPNVCREWDCAYKRIASMPPETRPDKLGVLFTIDRQQRPRSPFDRLYFVGLAIKDPKALYSKDTLNVAYMLANGPLPIYLSAGDQRELIYPREALAAAILDPGGSHDPALAEEAKAWMAKYEPFARLADEAARHTAMGAA